MKVQVLDEFCYAPPESIYSSFCYVEHYCKDNYDILFVGSQNGDIASFDIFRRLSKHNMKSDNLSKGFGHSGTVVCLMYTQHPRLCHSSKSGLLVSGSSDRTIKVWSPSNQLKPLVQTLVGHSGSIVSVMDGMDGTLVSCSVDGGIRVWTPQRGRQLMLHPFFECTFSLNGTKGSGEGSWLNAMVIRGTGGWACFLGDMHGNVEVYRKTNTDKVEIDSHVANFTGHLAKAAKWENLHALGISQLMYINADNYLITLSYDCSCKILDASLGQLLFLFENQRKCMYTGVEWSPSLMLFTFIDELGHVELFSNLTEKSKGTAFVIVPTAKQEKNIRESHKNPIISSISKYKPTEQLGYLSLNGEHGKVVLWKILLNDLCSEYLGHANTIVSVASLPGFTYDKTISAKRNPNARRRSKSYLFAPETDLESQENRKTRKDKSKIPEEKLFFSCSSDGFLKCWDEITKQECYSFRYNSGALGSNAILNPLESKTKTVLNGAERYKKVRKSGDYSYKIEEESSIIEITCMLALWEHNSLVTGAEDGTVTVWNADLGNKLLSKALRQPVTSIIKAEIRTNEVLVASDMSGVIAIWDLNLFAKNCTQLVIDQIIETNFHSVDDPTIFDLAYHYPSKTLFSAGQDATIRYWRVGIDIEAGCLTRPKLPSLKKKEQIMVEAPPTNSLLQDLNLETQPVRRGNSVKDLKPGRQLSVKNIPLSSDDDKPSYEQERGLYVIGDAFTKIQATDDYLISGDENGEMILWYIFVVPTPSKSGGLDGSPTRRASFNDTNVPAGSKSHLVIIPMVRWYCNVHNPLKSVFHAQQADQDVVYVSQGGCGVQSGLICIWKIQTNISTMILEREFTISSSVNIPKSAPLDSAGRRRGVGILISDVDQQKLFDFNAKNNFSGGIVVNTGLTARPPGTPGVAFADTVENKPTTDVQKDSAAPVKVDTALENEEDDTVIQTSEYELIINVKCNNVQGSLPDAEAGGCSTVFSRNVNTDTPIILMNYADISRSLLKLFSGLSVLSIENIFHISGSTVSQPSCMQLVLQKENSQTVNVSANSQRKKSMAINSLDEMFTEKPNDESGRSSRRGSVGLISPCEALPKCLYIGSIDGTITQVHIA